MKESQKEDQNNKEILEEGSYLEKLLRSVILAYQEAYNTHNEKNEIEYVVTITNHKVPTPEGNKDVAYLRLERGLRPRSTTQLNPTTQELEVVEADWERMLIHQEIYTFKNIQERLNKDAPWKDDLYLRTIARIIGAGLEYAELLRKLKNQELTQKAVQETEAEPKIIVTSEMPKPLTKDEIKYKKWVERNNENV